MYSPIRLGDLDCSDFYIFGKHRDHIQTKDEDAFPYQRSYDSGCMSGGNNFPINIWNVVSLRDRRTALTNSTRRTSERKMGPITLAIGISAITFGIFSGVIRLVKPRIFKKLAPMK